MVLDIASVERFRKRIEDWLGLRFEESKSAFLGEVLQRRLIATGKDCAAYLGSLKPGGSPNELPALARELTVGETYFFRNIDQFRAFAEDGHPLSDPGQKLAADDSASFCWMRVG